MRRLSTSSGLAPVGLSVDESFKDAVLNRLAEVANVAQFVSFTPGDQLATRFCRIRGIPNDHRFSNEFEAVGAVLLAAPDAKVNIRSFRPGDTQNQEFIYGLTTVGEVVAHLQRLARSGLYTIVNETIDIRDGGISGVSYGGVVEFAPEDTPRCVEKPGAAALPLGVGLRLLETVYGFRPQIEFGAARVEFSIHPLRRGLRSDHTIIWELNETISTSIQRQITWPNRFSEFIGDKVYGLLVAVSAGLHVPQTYAIARRVAPFQFGTNTGSAETWLRTCPKRQVPGRYPTFRGWRDPFAILAKEDPEGTAIRSVLAQGGVDAEWSGALITRDQDILVEGVAGFGDQFMQGRRPPERLPQPVRRAVLSAYNEARDALGSVRMEWAYDGKIVWVLQLHVGRSVGRGLVIVPGEVDEWYRFDVRQGLEALRQHVEGPIWNKHGVILVGDVGLTSHFADVLRRANIPSRIAPNTGADGDS